MKRSALPLVCGRYAPVKLCLSSSASHVRRNSLERNAGPLSVSTPYAHTQGGEVCDGVLQKLNSARFAFVRIKIGKPNPAMVVDRNEQVMSRNNLLDLRALVLVVMFAVAPRNEAIGMTIEEPSGPRFPAQCRPCRRVCPALCACSWLCRRRKFRLLRRSQSTAGNLLPQGRRGPSGTCPMRSCRSQNPDRGSSGSTPRLIEHQAATR
jgi:hypothetical protein